MANKFNTFLIGFMPIAMNLIFYLQDGRNTHPVQNPAAKPYAAGFFNWFR
jgi:hypothetical protein